MINKVYFCCKQCEFGFWIEGIDEETVIEFCPACGAKDLDLPSGHYVDAATRTGMYDQF